MPHPVLGPGPEGDVEGAAGGQLAVRDPEPAGNMTMQVVSPMSSSS
jgi:hypothetical protein